MSVLAELLGDHVSVVETRWPTGDEALLWPEEAASLGYVVEKRRVEFVTGRRCARLAMAKLGTQPTPVLTGPRREPIWPAGLVGSITHTTDFVAAAVAGSAVCGGLGIDAEPDVEIADDVVRQIAFGEELEWLATQSEFRCAGRLLFTIKEATFKVWYPLTGRWLGFDDAVVSVAPVADGTPSGSFVVRLRGHGPITEVSGKFAVRDGIIVAAIAIAPRFLPPGARPN